MRAMKARILKAGTLSVHSQEFRQRTQILSIQEVHFPCFNCFLWLLPESVDHSHLDEEGEKDNATSEIFILVTFQGVNFFRHLYKILLDM